MANEKRLIDANALIWKLKQHHDLFINEWEGFSNLPDKDKARVDEISNCIADVFNAPTVDAVEVVRCRDCKWCSHNTPDGFRWCDEHERGSLCDDDYCSCGERKDNEIKR